jgi:DHA2 family multidrug resistance protein
VLFATLALLPPLLQDLLNYSVLTTGLVTAPRGIGTLAAMVILGRLGRSIDPRYIIASGFALTALSLWLMTGFDLQMNEAAVIWTGIAQGLGTGFVYVPLAAATFATLSPQLRNEGTALFSLTRNVGSSIGISVVEVLLTRNTQVMHARLGEDLSIFSPRVHSYLVGADPGTAVAGLNAMLTRQAAMIAYNNDFKFMLVLTLITMPLIVVLRRPKSANAPAVLIE